jgi:hypothetical protein
MCADWGWPAGTRGESGSALPECRNGGREITLHEADSGGRGLAGWYVKAVAVTASFYEPFLFKRQLVCSPWERYM